MYDTKLTLYTNNLPGPFNARLLSAREAAFCISKSEESNKCIIGSKNCVVTGSDPIQI